MRKNSLTSIIILFCSFQVLAQTSANKDGIDNWGSDIDSAFNKASKKIDDNFNSLSKVKKEHTEERQKIDKFKICHDNGGSISLLNQVGPVDVKSTNESSKKMSQTCFVYKCTGKGLGVRIKRFCDIHPTNKPAKISQDSIEKLLDTKSVVEVNEGKRIDKKFQECLRYGGDVRTLSAKEVPTKSKDPNIKKSIIIKTIKCESSSISATKTVREHIWSSTFDMDEELKKINASKGDCHYKNDLRSACEDPITGDEYQLADPRNLAEDDTISDKFGRSTANQGTNTNRGGAADER